MSQNHRRIVIEFINGETKQIVIDQHRGARVDAERVIHFYRTEGDNRPQEIYAAPAESVQGWG